MPSMGLSFTRMAIIALLLMGAANVFFLSSRGGPGSSTARSSRRLHKGHGHPHKRQEPSRHLSQATIAPAAKSNCKDGDPGCTSNGPPLAPCNKTTAGPVGCPLLGKDEQGREQKVYWHPIPLGADACKDTSAECATWAKSGECGKNPSYMHATCPLTCAACPHLTTLPTPLAQVRLNNGVLMPTIGYGCAGLGDVTLNTVGWAIKAGYKLLDSAQAREWYREDLVGEAIAASAAPRASLFITSKLHPRHLGYDVTLKQFNASLTDLRTAYLDQFLLHYPECWGSLCGEGVKPAGTFLDSWRAMEELYDKGLVRSIGVSNFAAHQLQKLLQHARVRPQVLQVHVDPLAYDPGLLDLARDNDIQVVAYSTLGTQWGAAQNPVLNNAELKAIGQELGGKSAAQVALRWALQMGLIVLPRSSNEGRIAQNLKLFDYGPLSDAQMLRISKLQKQHY